MIPLWASMPVSFVLGAALTPIVRAAAHRLAFYARPTPDRWHRKPVALLGGIAIAAAALITIAVGAPLRPIVPLLVCSTLMFTLGLVDDLWRTRATTKLVGQTVVAAVVVYLAPQVHITGVPAADSLLAIVWIVGITNAFNLLDNMDGLSAGVAAIAGLCYLSVLMPSAPVPIVFAMGAFVGGVLGFLIYNFQPASIFMGDCGSLFIGSFLAAAGLLAVPELKTELAPVAAIPVFILLIPIFDTAFVTLTRGLAGRSALVGGRDHTSHRLVALGISERRAVLSLYGLALAGGLVALSITHLTFGSASILMAGYLVCVVGVGVFLGHVETARDAVPLDAEPPLPSEITARYRVYEVMLDIALIALAYYASLRIRFQGEELTVFLAPFARSFPIVVGSQLAGLWVAGKYRQIATRFGAVELLTILRGIMLGVASSVILVLFLYRFEGFSRAMFVVDAVILSFVLVGSRVALSTIDDYLRKQRTRGRRVLIYGAGRGGMLIVRELLQNTRLALAPVGFLDDDPLKRRQKLEGLPVVGTVVDLPAVARRLRVDEVLVSIRDLSEDQAGLLSRICREQNIALRRMRLTIEEFPAVDAARSRHDR
jgi:UDP-GlcNAc:undecaprenyl-phosphate/decaprenyl-phosphate GlcNAc-1-phosphate transferase